MKRHTQKGDYMPIEGANCLNLVTAIIDHYKRQPKRLKTIFLNATHWRMFVEDMKKVDDSYPANAIDGVPIADSDVTVKRGSTLQLKEFQYDFYTPAELGFKIKGVS
jgi:hypothetical protein